MLEGQNVAVLWNSIALTSIVISELANTIKYGEGVSYNFVFTEFLFKAVSGDVTAFPRIFKFRNHELATHYSLNISKIS